MSNKINHSPRLPKLFKELGLDNYKSLFVIDVGASGGIHDRWNLFGQTVTGHIQWGEAMYFRDLADKNYSQKFNFPVSLDKVIKLACLFEVHGLNDCAAELLINRAEEFGFTKHLDVLLNALTTPFRGKHFTYKEYVKRFDKNPNAWFPSVEEKISNKLSQCITFWCHILAKPLCGGYKLLKKITK